MHSKEVESQVAELFKAGYALYDGQKCMEAIDKFTRALEAAKQFAAQCANDEATRLRFRKLEGRALGNLASIHDHLCQYKEGLERNESCLEIMQEINDRDMEIKVLNNMGVAMLSLKDYKRSLEYHQKMYKRMQDPPQMSRPKLDAIKKRIHLIQRKVDEEKLD